MARVVGQVGTTTKQPSSREAVGKDMVKFNLVVMQIFKRTEDGALADAVKRTPISLIISSRDLACDCPKIKVNKYVGSERALKEHTIKLIELSAIFFLPQILPNSGKRRWRYINYTRPQWQINFHWVERSVG